MVKDVIKMLVLVKCCYIFSLFILVWSNVCTKLSTVYDKEDRLHSIEVKKCDGCVSQEIPKRQYKVNRTYIVKIKCCPGYVKRDELLKASSENCVLPCYFECQNGRCSEQDDCECYEGYERDPIRNSCIAKCGVGFMKIGVVCQPICRKPCIGGRCVAPDECACYEGTYLNERYECVNDQSCNPPCGNGTCTYGKGCNCQEGYKLSRNTNVQCIPSCSLCEVPACVAPGRCECPKYYKPKYLTAEGEDCDCSKDCDTICNKFLCDLTSTNITINNNISQVYGARSSTFESSNATILYVSVAANVILLLGIVVILRKCLFRRCQKRGQENGETSEYVAQYTDMRGNQHDVRGDEPPQYELIREENISEYNRAQYTDMRGIHRNNPTHPPQYDDIRESNGAAESLCYDYIQTPLPIFIRKCQQ